MAIRATVERQFEYGYNKQLVKRTEAVMTFPQAVELDADVIAQVEDFYLQTAEIADYEHDGMQSVIKYELGAVVVVTYEEV